MAHLDNLIDSVQDPELRSALQSEVRKVLNNRQFGLVFNPHKPESIVLPGFKVRRGDKVRVLVEGTADRTETDNSGVWVVLSIKNGTAVLRSKTDASQTREVSLDRLVIVREFGDPIFPGLKSTDRIERAPEKPWHALINGENFHALQALLYPYEGKVDAIYIDPPYNTRDKDWKYNNDYVDTTDPYKHSKWLSMMDRRLRMAKRLLNPTNSVLLVAIDEKEYLRLGMLLEQIFPAAKIQMVSTQINPAVVARAGRFGRSDEYIYCVMIGDAAPLKLPLGREWVSAKGRTHTGQVRWDLLRRSGEGATRQDSPGCFYPIYVDPSVPKVHSVGDALPDGVSSPAEIPGTVAVLPIRKDGSEGRWQWAPDTFRSRHPQGRVRITGNAKKGFVVSILKDGEYAKVVNGEFQQTGVAPDGSIEVATKSVDTVVATPGTQWHISSHDATQYGTRLLAQLLPGRSFPFPKSLYAVEDALRFFVADKPYALVVDFFAGSGTTAHALMRLNRQDQGMRRSILVTNNEVSPAEAKDLRSRGANPGDPAWEALGICDHVTKPRLAAAVTGRTPDGSPVKGDYKFVDEFPMAEGFNENVEFFQLTYEDPALISLGRRFSAISPLLWMKSGASGPRIDQIDASGWSIPDGASYGVLFDTSKWSDFVAAANSRHGGGTPLIHAFVVTDSYSEYQQIVSRLDPALGTTRLYADYLRTFEINTIDE